MTALLSTTAFIIALVSVGFTEVIKKNLPEKAQANWVLSIINIVTVALSTAVYALSSKMGLTEALITGAGAFAIAQVEYNYLFKLFTAVIDKLKTKSLPDMEVTDEAVDKVAEKLSK